MLLGPNCMGVAAPEEVSLWIGTVPDTFRPGRVSVVSQSGSIAEALLGIGPRVGFRSVVSSGGEAVTDAADILGFFARGRGDRRDRALPGDRAPAGRVRVRARGCAEAGKPVVCLKVGRSQAAARAALAHTGAVVGSERAFSALLRRHGAVEVDDFTALVETLEVLGRARRPRGKRIAAISESGGEGALLADQGEAAGIPFEPLPDSVAAELTARFPNYGAPGNPLDAWAIDEAEAVFPGSIEVLVGSGAFDIVVAQADQSQFRGAEEHEWCFMIVKALAEATVGTDTFPAVTTVSAVDPPAGGGRVRARARCRPPAGTARRDARARGRGKPSARFRDSPSPQRRSSWPTCSRKARCRSSSRRSCWSATACRSRRAAGRRLRRRRPRPQPSSASPWS